MNWAVQRLDELKAGTATFPPVVEQLMLGGLTDWGEGWALKRWSPAPQLANVDGSLFGGYIAALADQALAFAAMTVVPEDRAFRTINLQVDFLRIGRLQPLRIEAKVVAQTRQVITVRATFERDDGELVAAAGAQQMVLPRQTV